jgi:hypothetical protein
LHPPGPSKKDFLLWSPRVADTFSSGDEEGKTRCLIAAASATTFAPDEIVDAKRGLSGMVAHLRRSIQALPAPKPTLIYPALFWFAAAMLIAARFWVAP